MQNLFSKLWKTKYFSSFEMKLHFKKHTQTHKHTHTNTRTHTHTHTNTHTHTPADGGDHYGEWWDKQTHSICCCNCRLQWSCFVSLQWNKLKLLQRVLRGCDVIKGESHEAWSYSSSLSSSLLNKDNIKKVQQKFTIWSFISFVQSSASRSETWSINSEEAAVPLTTTRVWLQQWVSPHRLPCSNVQLYSRKKHVYSLVQKLFWSLEIISSFMTPVRLNFVYILLRTKVMESFWISLGVRGGVRHCQDGGSGAAHSELLLEFSTTGCRQRYDL